MSIASFFNDYFIHPILIDSGYNVFNTLAYALLAIVILYGVYAALKKLKLKVDVRLFYAALPFVVFGSITRAFVDHGYYAMTPWKKFLLISPGVWLFSVALFCLSFVLAYFLYKQYKLSVWKMTAMLGSLAVVTSLLTVINELAFEWLVGIAVILLIFILLCLAIYFGAKHCQISAFTNKVGFAAIACQLWDGVNTSTILSMYGGWEKHFVPRWLIKNFGPWSFLLAKIAILLPSVYLLYRYVEDRALRNTFLIGIAIFGLGEGLRNFVSFVLV